MTRVGQAWRQWWFAETDLFSMGVFRVLFLGVLSLRTVNRWSSGMHFIEESPYELIETGTFQILFPFGPEFFVDHIVGFKVLSLLALTGGLLGVLTRSSLIVYTWTYWVEYGYLSSFGQFDHATALVAFVLAALCCSPGIECVSFDRYWRNRRTHAVAERLPFWSERISPWGAKFILLLIAVYYCSSGIAKVRFGGIEWMDGQSLAFNLSEKRQNHFVANGENTFRDGVGLASFLYDAQENRPLGIALSREPEVMRVLAILTVLLESSFFLILFHRYLMYAFFMSAAVFHFVIIQTMGINFFTTVVPAFAIAVPWGRILESLPWTANRRRADS